RAAHVEVEEAPLVVGPVVGLVTESEGAARSHRTAVIAGPPASGRAGPVGLIIEEHDDLGIDAGVGGLGRIVPADPELEIAVPVARVQGAGDRRGVVAE